MPSWETEVTSPTVTTLRLPLERVTGWEQWILLTSDRHLDNPLSNRKLQKQHLDLALERNAPVIDLGDLFCAMQGRSDPRHEKGHTRPGDTVQDYFGQLVRSAVDFFNPYSSILAVLGQGNHESKILKHNEIDLGAALVDRLRDRGSRVVQGGYRGWVRLLFEQSRGKGQYRQSRNLYYTHGAGGSAPVSKGIIKTNRRAVMLPDADIVVGGHIHEAWYLEIMRCRITEQGREWVDEQIHLCTATYKEEFTDLGGGFHHEKEGAPKPLGGWWLRFWWDRGAGPAGQVKMEATRAK